MHNKLSLLLSLALFGASACVAPLPKGYEAHPQGLLPSQDTSTTPLNFLELEGLSSQGSKEQTTSVAMRYGITSRSEVYLVQELHHAIDTAGAQNASGTGDAWLGLRHRLANTDPKGGKHAFAAEVRIPHSDPDAGIGSGQLELHVLHIRDSTWAGYDITTNTGVKLIGDGENRPDPALTASITMTDPLVSVAGKQLPFGLIAELGGLWQPEETYYPAYAALGIRIPIHPSLELQIARIEELGGWATEPRWALSLGRLVGDSLNLQRR